MIAYDPSLKIEAFSGGAQMPEMGAMPGMPTVGLD